jgi:hypothetical protein
VPAQVQVLLLAEVHRGGAVVQGCMGLWGLAMLLGGGSVLQGCLLLLAAAGAHSVAVVSGCSATYALHVGMGMPGVHAHHADDDSLTIPQAYMTRRSEIVSMLAGMR